MVLVIWSTAFNGGCVILSQVVRRAPHPMHRRVHAHVHGHGGGRSRQWRVAVAKYEPNAVARVEHRHKSERNQRAQQQGGQQQRYPPPHPFTALPAQETLDLVVIIGTLPRARILPLAHQEVKSKTTPGSCWSYPNEWPSSAGGKPETPHL